MTPAWFVVFILLWTGFLAGTASLVTHGRVPARFAQLVWRGAGLLAVFPLLVMAAVSLMPQQMPAALPDIPYVEPAAGAVTSATVTLQSAVSGPEWAWTGPALLALLAAGWLYRLAMGLCGQLRLQRLKSRSMVHWRNIDAFPLTQLGLERVPPVRLIPDGSPFIAGIAGRAVYVPEGLEAPGDLRRIVIHECVHLKRGDLITRPMERMIADIFWFSPFAWMMRRELDFWREAVCDEIASTLSGDRIAYARTLAQAARIATPQRALPVAAFILPRKRSLPMRLDRLLEVRPARSRPLAALGASLAALALTPLALAEVKQAETADKGEGRAMFGHAILMSGEAKVSSTFGKRSDPLNGKVRLHKGTDIKAPMGTPVHTPGCGTVIFSDFKKGYGETIEIAYEDGTRMRFSQLSKRLVTAGDEVSTGTVIGKVGASGRATGPHLHLEHWKPGVDSKTGKTALAPQDPQTTEGLVLYAAG
ncbi:M23/M56 family metallopeptidase [Henriciella sp.]|uniref:M23/M56 family metallopeptidase n=1 Tax=Henriciella sp. TaxID=1968823 RepID=UPI002634DFC5|nr:M23/M56 family metallopeptidase [Henriciella sp.]